MASLAEIQAIVEQIKADLPLLINRSQIAPKQIVTITGLSDISERLGLVQAGEFRAGNGVEPGFGFTGVRMGYPAFAYASDTWHLAGVHDDVLQFGLSAFDGKAYFAAGGAILDTEGATFKAQNNQSYFLFWKTDDDQTVVGKIGAFYVSTDSGIEVVGQQKAGFVPVAHLMTADEDGAFVTGIEVRGDGQVQIDLRTSSSDAVNQQMVRVMSDVNEDNATSAMMQFELESKSTPAAGFGVNFPIYADNAAKLQKQIGGFEWVYLTASNGAENSHIIAKYISGGTVKNVPLSQEPKYIPIVLHDRSGATTVPSVDAHGSLAQVPHYHFPDGGGWVIESLSHIVIPADYKGGTISVNWIWSSSAAGGNVRWQVLVRLVGNGYTAHDIRLANNFTIAAPAAANTTKLSTVDLASDPAAGHLMDIYIARLGADAADTNTGQVSLWGAYLSYEAYS
jgi:hypothetical protein